MHSDGMSADARTPPPDARLMIDQSQSGRRRPPSKFVRLSQIRKLREWEQVAAVCYRVRNDVIEFLLVRTRGRRRWTFPKGSAEPGLTHAQAAALEAFEEAGVHGRIEEVPFARYVRSKRGYTVKPGPKSGEKVFTVAAHLCEVLRLGRSQESDRDRTWFSAEDARRLLQDGRKTEDGVRLARIIGKAVDRIQRGGTGVAGDRREDKRGEKDRRGKDRREKDRLQNRPRLGALRFDALQKDALQKVQFDFAEGYGSVQEASFSVLPYMLRQTGGERQTAVPVAAPRREILQCEVLEFGQAGEKTTKALGSGSKNG